MFVDNYLDGGYHVPYLHKGLDSVLDYSNYMIENGERHCLQWSPIVSEGAEAQTGAVRKGDRALYYWIYPNFMINWYDGVMDTNLVVPRGVDQTEVIFDFYFPDVVSEERAQRNRASVEVGQRIQDEDVAICKSVQRGLNSRAYNAGRLSVRREAGEHLFHRLLHADLSSTFDKSQIRQDSLINPANLANPVNRMTNSRPSAARARRWLWSRCNHRQHDRRRDLSRARHDR